MYVSEELKLVSFMNDYKLVYKYLIHLKYSHL